MAKSTALEKMRDQEEEEEERQIQTESTEWHHKLSKTTKPSKITTQQQRDPKNNCIRLCFLHAIFDFRMCTTGVTIMVHGSRKQQQE